LQGERSGTHADPAPLTAPIVSFLQFIIHQDKIEPFERFLDRITREALEFPGCLWAYSFKAEDMAANYIVLSGWTDSIRIQEFEEVPRHVRAARMGEEEFFAQPMIMRRYKNFP
jgi:quinol monooxygenase YgiN